MRPWAGCCMRCPSPGPRRPLHPWVCLPAVRTASFPPWMLRWSLPPGHTSGSTCAADHGRQVGWCLGSSSPVSRLQLPVWISSGPERVRHSSERGRWSDISWKSLLEKQIWLDKRRKECEVKNRRKQRQRCIFRLPTSWRQKHRKGESSHYLTKQDPLTSKYGALTSTNLPTNTMM